MPQPRQRRRHRRPQQPPQDLPDGDFGIASTSSSAWICLYAATCAARKRLQLPELGAAPAAATTKAFGTSPRLVVGHPDHRGVGHPGMRDSSASISAGATWKPLTLISSFTRSTIVM